MVGLSRSSSSPAPLTTRRSSSPPPWPGVRQRVPGGLKGRSPRASPTSGTSPLLPVFRALRQPPSSRSILPTKSSHRSENSPSRSRSSLPSPRSSATTAPAGSGASTQTTRVSWSVCLLYLADAIYADPGVQSASPQDEHHKLKEPPNGHRRRQIHHRDPCDPWPSWRAER